MGLINYRKQNRPYQRIYKTNDDKKITLKDVTGKVIFKQIERKFSS